MTDLLFDTLFDKAPFFLGIKDKEGRFTHINGPFLVWLSKSKAKLIGKPAHVVWFEGHDFTPIQAADNKVIVARKLQKLKVQIMISFLLNTRSVPFIGTFLPLATFQST